MKVWLPLLLCAVLLGTVLSCRKSDKSPIPYIELISLSPDSVKMLSLDTVYLTFNFADGDGDLGNDISQSYDVFLQDTRDTNLIETLRFPFPEIPDEARDPVDGLRGTGSISLLARDIIVRNDTLHSKIDTLTLKMWIIDRARNKSNVIETPKIFLYR